MIAKGVFYAVFPDPKVSKMKLEAFPSLLAFKLSFADCFFSLLFPLGVTDFAASPSFTFLSGDECEREFCLPKDFRLVG